MAAEFQLTRPRGARLLLRSLLLLCSGFQLTRPRGARPRRALKALMRLGFNSRAREGRDPPAPTSHPSRSSFNSRAREGRDAGKGGFEELVDVSTHAPARGATHQQQDRLHLARFQLTRPRGARPLCRRRLHRSPCFNSRAREGRDLLLLLDLSLPDVSTHAPARGAT